MEHEEMEKCAHPSGGSPKSKKRMWMYVIFFLAVMFLTFSLFFENTEIDDIYEALERMNPVYLAAAVFTAIFFVSAEGILIWYLLSSMQRGTGAPHKKTRLPRCIAYAFIGFFYSGITPSATGGQPMQLYYMKKDGSRLADGSVVLMTVAVIYKLVLSVIGAGILLLWYQPLSRYLGTYMPLYVLGLFLNAGLVAVLLFVMLAPGMAGRLLHCGERFAVKIRLMKPSPERRMKIDAFVDGYRASVAFLRERKGKIAVVVMGTFLQRFSVFFLTWLVYRGFRLEGTPMLDIMWLQAVVYIAVDMLPVPGAQGITELVYRKVFAQVFPRRLLMPSMLAVRGLNFYLVLVLSLLVVLWNMFRMRIASRK